MVLNMKLNDICKKLVWANIRNYKILIFCTTIATMLFTAYGLLIFSPTITNVIMDRGSTQQIAYGIYAAFSVACLIFILYSHSLFMKYKEREIGIFISLGINRNNVKKVLLKELIYIIPIFSILGMALAIPFSYLTWAGISLIINRTDIAYKVGWIGLVGGIIFSFFVILMLNIKTTKYLKKVDIMSIMKSGDSIEEVKCGNYVLGLIGIVIIPIGIYCADANIRGVLFSSIGFLKYIFIAMIIIGTYFVASSFTELGNFIKRVSPKKYYKNILFLNLLKFKGKQYTLTLFTVIILMAITIFSMCSSFTDILAAKDIADIEYIFDYSIIKSKDQNEGLEKSAIDSIAHKNNINIKDYNEVEILEIGKKSQDTDSISSAYLISEESYNKMHNKNIDVKSGGYHLISSEKGILKVQRYNEAEFVPIGSDDSYNFKKQSELHQNMIPGKHAAASFVLDKDDFEKLKLKSPKEAVETAIMFNVDDWRESYNFNNDFINFVFGINDRGLKIDGSIFNYTYYDVEDLFVSQENMTDIDYRDWSYKVYSKIYQATDGLKLEIIYPLLFGFIALLGLIASAMILYVKVLNTSWQDSGVYQNILLIGANKKLIKSTIVKQLMIIFLIPTIIGCFAGAFISITMRSHDLAVSIYTQYAIIFAIVFMIVQFIVFLLTKKEILRIAIKSDFINE